MTGGEPQQVRRTKVSAPWVRNGVSLCDLVYPLFKLRGPATVSRACGIAVGFAEALTRLAAARPQAAEVVKLRFFAGLTLEEIAPLLAVSPRSCRRLWAFARAWLRRDMERSGESAP